MVEFPSGLTEYEEEWMVMLVTDHGRDSFGWNHGDQTESEKTIFYGFWFFNLEDHEVIQRKKCRMV